MRVVVRLWTVYHNLVMSKSKQSTRQPVSDCRAAGTVEGGLSGLAAGVLLIAMTVFAYSPVYNAGFVWDDDDYVYENPLLTSPDGLRRIWTTAQSPQYYPLVFTTFWIEYRLWGVSAGGYHIVNVLLHAINAVLIWRLLRRMGFGGAYVVALIFALHPVHVESVAWITERKNVLSALFYLLSIKSYLRFEATERRRWYATALLLFMLGLLAKTVICTLPVVLLLLRWWRRQPIGIRHVLRLVPFAVAGGIMGVVTVLYEHHNVLHGAYGAHWALSVPERVIVAGRALWFYIGKLLWPSPLVFNYPRWRIETVEPLAWLWPLAAVLVAIALWALRNRWGRGFAIAACFTVITLSPALGFVNVAPMRFSFVADHFQYVASIGVIASVVALAGVLIQYASQSFKAHTRRSSIRALGIVLTAVVVVALGTLTYRQACLYRNVEDLWRHTIQYNPGSWLARGNLGVLLRRRGDLDEATQHFQYILDHCAAWPEPQVQAHTNLGHIRRLQGEYEKAVHLYEQALAAMPNKHEARFSLGVTYFALDAYEEAEREYRRYLEDNPDDARAHFNLALTLEAQERPSEAEARYHEALRFDPQLALAHIKLAGLYLRQDHPEQAENHYLAAMELRPRNVDSRVQYADFLESLGRGQEAIELLQAGLSLDPKSKQLKSALAALEGVESESPPD